jgi:hypothetical protein
MYTEWVRTIHVLGCFFSCPIVCDVIFSLMRIIFKNGIYIVKKQLYSASCWCCGRAYIDIRNVVQIPAQNFNFLFVRLIDHIRICIGWLITHDFVCVNSHVWICITAQNFNFFSYDWSITYEFVLVDWSHTNAYLWTRMCEFVSLATRLVLCLQGIVRKGIVWKGTSRAMGKETWYSKS